MKDERERWVNGDSIFVHRMKNFKARDCLRGQTAWLEMSQTMPTGNQVQAMQSFRLVSWLRQGCCMTGACLSPAVSVHFTVVAAIQIPTSAKPGEDQFCQTLFQLCPFPWLGDLVTFFSTSLKQELPPFFPDSLCCVFHHFTSLWIQLAGPSNGSFCTWASSFPHRVCWLPTCYRNI